MYKNLLQLDAYILLVGMIERSKTKKKSKRRKGTGEFGQSRHALWDPKENSVSLIIFHSYFQSCS